eukprot:TRINITY_DN23347_c1_g1_i1.p1 TRINITY_DN23347_c1_g1~~TRINITY_DN23347_c1_g1_i1.p1  ORF type:complete len:429 (+),score=122.88 TRINITY_DN23347_c1_g1_i1:100-1386(+)
MGIDDLVAGSTKSWLVPSAVTNLRACKRCRVIQTKDQFFKSGCPTCREVLDMKENEARVAACTTGNYHGILAIMRPGTFTSRFNGLEKNSPGLYALAVHGTIPPHIFHESESEEEPEEVPAAAGAEEEVEEEYTEEQWADWVKDQEAKAAADAIVAAVAAEGPTPTPTAGAPDTPGPSYVGAVAPTPGKAVSGEAPAYAQPVTPATQMPPTPAGVANDTVDFNAPAPETPALAAPLAGEKAKGKGKGKGKKGRVPKPPPAPKQPKVKAVKPPSEIKTAAEKRREERLAAEMATFSPVSAFSDSDPEIDDLVKNRLQKHGDASSVASSDVEGVGGGNRKKLALDAEGNWKQAVDLTAGYTPAYPSSPAEPSNPSQPATPQSVKRKAPPESPLRDEQERPAAKAKAKGRPKAKAKAAQELLPAEPDTEFA